MDSQSLVTQVIYNRKTTCGLADLAFFVQNQLLDPSSRQIRERLNKGLHIAFNLSDDVVLQCVVQSRLFFYISESFIGNSITRRITNKLSDITDKNRCCTTDVGSFVGHSRA